MRSLTVMWMMGMLVLVACRPDPAPVREVDEPFASYRRQKHATSGSERRAPGGPPDDIGADAPHYELPFDAATSDDVDIMGCPLMFEKEARGAWHPLSGERYFIDNVGRPARAWTRLPPILLDEPRDTACQAAVGRWGDELDSARDYDGGHLIANQLGGWGKRANLVPQAASFNRGNWAQVENALARCDGLEDAQLTMEVVVEYADDATLVPSTMSMTLTDTASGDVLSVSFTNEPKGGALGTEERARAVAWLRDLGCE